MLVNIVKTGQNAAGTAHAMAVFSEPPPFAVNGESFDFGLGGRGERHSARTGSQGRQLTPPPPTSTFGFSEVSLLVGLSGRVEGEEWREAAFHYSKYQCCFICFDGDGSICVLMFLNSSLTCLL